LVFVEWILVIVAFVSQLGDGADRYNWDCGAASSSMMIQYYTGLKVKPDTLMDMIGRDRYTTPKDLEMFMNEYGLEITEGYGIPRIVLLNGDHWVVYLGDNYYHDPLHGPMRYGSLGSGWYVTSVTNDELWKLIK